MGKNKLMIGMLTGAIIGGLITLTDKTTRQYTKGKMQDATSKTKEFLNNPSEAIRSTQATFNQFNDTLQNGADSAVNALEQVETTLDKLSKKTDE